MPVGHRLTLHKVRAVCTSCRRHQLVADVTEGSISALGSAATQVDQQVIPTAKKVDTFLAVLCLMAETLRVSPPTGPSLIPRGAFLAHLVAATGAAVAALIPAIIRVILIRRWYHTTCGFFAASGSNHLARSLKPFSFVLNRLNGFRPRGWSPRRSGVGSAMGFGVGSETRIP